MPVYPMDRESIEFVISSLPGGRTVFHDFTDRYAFMLLEAVTKESGTSFSSLKKSKFRSLLSKPKVKEFFAQYGKPKITPSAFQAAWPSQPQAYRLTLGTWPSLERKPKKRWDQITRWCYNLVLQVNLSESHKRDLSKHVPDWSSAVSYDYHPIAHDGELTLAWARIDLDLETGEALIEEIQSDWVKYVKAYSHYGYTTA